LGGGEKLRGTSVLGRGKKKKKRETRFSSSHILSPIEHRRGRKESGNPLAGKEEEKRGRIGGIFESLSTHT